MGKSKNSELSFGTNGSPQTKLTQNNVDKKAKELAKRNKMLAKLEEAEVKYTPADVIFVTKDKSEKLIWLEKGNEAVGLIHILKNHKNDFDKKYNANQDKIIKIIKSFITNGKLEYSIIRNIKGRDGYERMYSKKGKYYLLTGIGINGFIVSAYPIHEKEAKEMIKIKCKEEKK